MMKKLLTAILLMVSLHTIAKPSAPVRTITRTVITTNDSVVTVPLVVAILAFISAGASLVVSSLSAFKIKQKEYQNEYYKKVIDKRIKAIEAAELLIGIFSRTIVYAQTGVRIHAYFHENLDSDIFNKAVSERDKYKIWYSTEANMLYVELSTLLARLLYDCRKLPNEDTRAEYVSSYTAKISAIKKELEVQLRKDMKDLHDVDGFFKAVTSPAQNYYFKPLNPSSPQ